MTGTQIVEIIASMGGVGAMAKVIQTATRIAAAVEALTEKMAKVVDKQDEAEKTLKEHEVRLAKGGL